MKIKLDKDFYIEIDDLNHTLHQKYMGKSKNGEKKEMDKVLGYHPDVEACVEQYLDARVKLLAPEKALTLRQYMDLVKKSNKEAVKAIKEVIEGSGKGCKQ